MPSGKATRRKRAAAAQRPQRPVRRDTRTADRRLWVLGGVVAALVVAVVIGAVVATSGGNGGDDTASRNGDGTTLLDATEAIALFEGIPQQGLALGEPDAPVTMLEFADLQCPFCREFAVETLQQLVERHVRTGELRIELRGLAFIGPDPSAASVPPTRLPARTGCSSSPSSSTNRGRRSVPPGHPFSR